MQVDDHRRPRPGRSTTAVRRAYCDRPGVLHGRRRAPASAVQRAGLQHVDPGRVQPGLEAGAGARGARPARRCSTPTTPSARRSASRSSTARQPEHRRVRRRSSRRSACSTPPTPTLMVAAHGGPQARHAGGGEAARRAARGHRVQGLRVQRPRRGDGPALRSAAVVPDGTPSPRSGRDPELYHQPTTGPARQLPHAWLGRRRPPAVSTLDLVGHGPVHRASPASAGTGWEEAAGRGRGANSASSWPRRDRPRPRVRSTCTGTGPGSAGRRRRGVLARPDSTSRSGGPRPRAEAEQPGGACAPC